MTIKPLQDRVLVKRLDENTKTAGGIIIPDTAKEKPSEGIVEAVGPGMVTPEGKVIPMSVKVGDKVLFGKWSGTEIKVNGEDRLIIKEPEILAIISPNNEHLERFIVGSKNSCTSMYTKIFLTP